jgi:hypothetical protein
MQILCRDSIACIKMHNFSSDLTLTRSGGKTLMRIELMKWRRDDWKSEIGNRICAGLFMERVYRALALSFLGVLVL